MTWKKSFTTGLRRGYIYACNRGVECEPRPIPDTVKGLRGNLRWALQRFIDAGCTHYTVADYQYMCFANGCRCSSKYCYSVYYGYKLD